MFLSYKKKKKAQDNPLFYTNYQKKSATHSIQQIRKIYKVTNIRSWFSQILICKSPKLKVEARVHNISKGESV